MNTESTETTETIEVTSDVITDDGVTVTPTRSPVKAALSDRPIVRILGIAAFLAAVGVGFALMFSMGLSASVKHELTHTTYDGAGCHNEAFFVTEFNQDTFDHYKVKHPDEQAKEVPCPIPWENNTNTNR